jgi:hypothetical protein
VLTEEESADYQAPSTLAVFNRRDLAIWDYDSVWDDTNQEIGNASSGRATSVQDSKRRLFEVLGTLKASLPTTTPTHAGSTFRSSRTRKAANAKRKAKTTPKRR